MITMITVQLTDTFRCTPDELLEFVLDIERYAEIDDKIRPVLWVRRDGDELEFACRPKLAGLRTPKVVQRIRRTGERAEISLAPRPRNRLTHLMAHFEASFVCARRDDATEVTRTLVFAFKPAVRWLVEPLLRRRLPGEVADELARAKALLEREHSG